MKSVDDDKYNHPWAELRRACSDRDRYREALEAITRVTPRLGGEAFRLYAIASSALRQEGEET
jgi:hypothetical protein